MPGMIITAIFVIIAIYLTYKKVWRPLWTNARIKQKLDDLNTEAHQAELIPGALKYSKKIKKNRKKLEDFKRL